MPIEFSSISNENLIVPEKHGTLTLFDLNESKRISSCFTSNNRVVFSVNANNGTADIDDTSYTAVWSIPWSVLRTFSKNGSITISLGYSLGGTAGSYSGQANGNIEIELDDGTTNYQLYYGNASVSTDGSNTASHSTSVTGFSTVMVIDLKNLEFLRGKYYQTTAVVSPSSGGSAGSSYTQLADSTDISSLNLDATNLYINMYARAKETDSGGNSSWTNSGYLSIFAGRVIE